MNLDNDKVEQFKIVELKSTRIVGKWPEKVNSGIFAKCEMGHIMWPFSHIQRMIDKY